VLFALGTVACSKIPDDQCRLVLRWEGAATDSLSPRLYLIHNDTLGESVVDTVEITERKGKQVLDIYVDTTYSHLTIRSEEPSWELAFDMPRATKVTMDVDWEHPHLLRVSGFPEADVRSKFIHGERKLLRRYDEALAQGNMPEADSLWSLVRHRLAEYIVDNKEKPGADLLMMEFLPGREGMLFFQQQYPTESLPEQFRYYHNERERWSAIGEKGRWVDWSLLPMPDSLRSRFTSRPDSAFRYAVVELLSTAGPSPYAKEIREVQKKKANRFIFLSYSLAPKAQGASLASGQGTLPNYYAIKSSAGSILYFSDQMGITQFPYYLVVDERDIVVAWGEDFSVLLKSLSSLP
jgi:putative lipoprotein